MGKSCVAKRVKVEWLFQYTPKIIKEKIEITEKDLRDLDMTTPAYLAQYGKYYAILSVTAENTGIANVELLQLDI